MNTLIKGMNFKNNADRDAFIAKWKQEGQNNQAAVNAASQFNATNQTQTDQFMDSLEIDIAKFNANQLNVMKQFNATQENEAEARRVANEVYINKFNA